MKILTVYEDETWHNPIVFARRIDIGDENANIEKCVNDFLEQEEAEPEDVSKEEIVHQLWRGVNPHGWMNERYCFAIVNIKED